MVKDNLILLHGALGSKQQFKSLKPMLSNHFNVLDLNFEGHGERPSNKGYSIDLFAENVIEFLHEKNISHSHIFGYSMGGYVGLQLALIKPSLVRRIMTLGTKFNWTKEIAKHEVSMLNPSKIEVKIPAFAKHLEELHTGTDWKVVMAKTAQMMIDLGNGKKLSDEDLKSIDHEVLIGIGALDRMVTLEESEYAASLIRKGRLKVMEDFKHPIEKIDMSQLAAVIRDFMHS